MTIKQKPEVSIIIATYNGARTLPFVIRSVLNQTIQDFEIIIVGDASNDQSESIVKSFGDNRLKWYNLPENSGSQPAPNNYGLKIAKGKYIAYLGHDDLWFPDHLEKALNLMNGGKVDFVNSISAMIPPSGEIYVIGTNQYKKRYRPVPPSSWIHERELVDRIGFWNEDYLEDIIPPDFNYLKRILHSSANVSTLKELTVVKFLSAGYKSYSKDSGIQDEIKGFWDEMETDADGLRIRILNKVAFQFSMNSVRRGLSIVEAYRLVRMGLFFRLREDFGNKKLLRWYFLREFRKSRKKFNQKRGLTF